MITECTTIPNSSTYNKKVSDPSCKRCILKSIFCKLASLASGVFVFSFVHLVHLDRVTWCWWLGVGGVMTANSITWRWWKLRFFSVVGGIWDGAIAPIIASNLQKQFHNVRLFKKLVYNLQK